MLAGIYSSRSPCPAMSGVCATDFFCANVCTSSDSHEFFGILTGVWPPVLWTYHWASHCGSTKEKVISGMFFLLDYSANIIKIFVIFKRKTLIMFEMMGKKILS